MQIAYNMNEVMETAEKAPALVSHMVPASRKGDSVWTVELIHDYWNSLNVRFLKDDELVTISFINKTDAKTKWKMLNNLGDALKVAWLAAGGKAILDRQELSASGLKRRSLYR
jgi:hypothetical protein